MITSKKLRTDRKNLIPVWDLPGEYYINLREPWQASDPGTPETFVCGIEKKNHQAVYTLLKEIVQRHGGTIAEKINCYGGISVKNMTDDAMEEICAIENVYTVWRNVSILPPQSHQFYRGKTDDKPIGYENDILSAALHLKAHGAL